MAAHAAQPTIASGAFKKLLASFAALGVDADALCAEVSIDRSKVEDRDARFPITKLWALWEACLARAPRPGSAVLVAQEYQPGDYGLVGFVAMNSATLGEALAHVVRYVGLWTDDPEMRLDERGVLRVAYDAKLPECLGRRVATEAAPAELLHGARVLTQTRVTPIEVRFAHEAPDDTSVHEAFFGCPVRFDAEDTAVVLRPEDLALPMPKADAQLGAFLRNMANDALASRPGRPASPHDRIRGIVAEELQRGVPGLDQIARRLATSERTLRRRLEESGTSFRALVDETRADLARSYVADPRLPLSEVAFLLGFSEPSAFHRAFKRWTGATPQAFRKRTGATM